MRSAVIAQLSASVRILVVMTIALGLVYPLATTGFAQLAFGERADGSLVRDDGVVVGSRLIAQSFVGDAYFHPRPSAAGFDGSASTGSNLGPTNDDLLTDVERRAVEYRVTNRLGADAPVPVDAVTASGSGLDPHISTANARLQSDRVAAARGLDPDTLDELIAQHTDRRPLGVLGDDGVNVLELNVALDELTGRP